MGSDDEFGRDTATIRAWLDKRATYANDREVPLPAVGPQAHGSPTSAPQQLPSARDAGRAVVDMLGTLAAGQDESVEAIETLEAPETFGAVEVESIRAEPELGSPTPAPTPAPTPPTTHDDRSVESVRPGRVPEPEQAAEPARATYYSISGEEDLPPAVIEFKPRTRIRRVLTFIMLAALALTIAAGILAASQPAPITLGVAAAFGVLLLVVWAVRASSSPTRLTVRRGQLEVVRAGQRHRIEIASPYTPVAVVGEPGKRGWQVLIEQVERPVLTLTAADVDPEPFMRVLLRLRPDLRGDRTA